MDENLGPSSSESTDVGERIQQLLSQAVDEQVTEQRQLQALLSEVRTALKQIKGEIREIATPQLRNELGAQSADIKAQFGQLDERLQAMLGAVGTSAQVLQGISGGLERVADLVREQAAEAARAEQAWTQPIADVREDVAGLRSRMDSIEGVLRSEVAGLHDRLGADLESVRTAAAESARNLAGHVDNAVLVLAEALLRRPAIGAGGGGAASATGGLGREAAVEALRRGDSAAALDLVAGEAPAPAAEQSAADGGLPDVASGAETAEADLPAEPEVEAPARLPAEPEPDLEPEAYAEPAADAAAEPEQPAEPAEPPFEESAGPERVERTELDSLTPLEEWMQGEELAPEGPGPVADRGSPLGDFEPLPPSSDSADILSYDSSGATALDLPPAAEPASTASDEDRRMPWEEPMDDPLGEGWADAPGDWERLLDEPISPTDTRIRPRPATLDPESTDAGGPEFRPWDLDRALFGTADRPAAEATGEGEPGATAQDDSQPGEADEFEDGDDHRRRPWWRPGS